MSSRYFKESVMIFLIATTNHSQDFTNNEHCVSQDMSTSARLWQLCIKAWKYKQNVNKSHGEVEFFDESTFYQQ